MEFNQYFAWGWLFTLSLFGAANVYLTLKQRLDLVKLQAITNSMTYMQSKTRQTQLSILEDLAILKSNETETEKKNPSQNLFETD